MKASRPTSSSEGLLYARSMLNREQATLRERRQTVTDAPNFSVRDLNEIDRQISAIERKKLTLDKEIDEARLRESTVATAQAGADFKLGNE